MLSPCPQSAHEQELRELQARLDRLSDEHGALTTERNDLHAQLVQARDKGEFLQNQVASLKAKAGASNESGAEAYGALERRMAETEQELKEAQVRHS